MTADEFNFGTQVVTEENRIIDETTGELEEIGSQRKRFGISRMFNEEPQTITISGPEIEAYNALTEMGNYERQLIIEQTIDQLKSRDVTSSAVTQYLKNIDLTTN